MDTHTTRRTFLANSATAAAAFGALAGAGHASAQEGKKMATDNVKKILIAADPFALALKDGIVAHLKQKGFEVVDMGATAEKQIPYFESAVAVSKALQAGQGDRAILFCGTGMGMAVIANRFKGVTASVVESIFAARMCRAINDANALCLGSMVWAEWMAKEAVDVFLATGFTEGMDFVKDFLIDARAKVEAIRP
ncbi:MAG: RpiB/LacA/LacB family sugar-phosphate isomerase [Kiritimatiellaeota bacterium]|nr:RpiB/LacA/LacB family sugar-phosphate isomerase [Kiritimatiellota bacterium]